MEEGYELKYMQLLAEFSERVWKIRSAQEAERCLDLFKFIERATPPFMRMTAMLIHEGIIRRMKDILDGEPGDGVEGVYVILFCDGHIKIGRTNQFHIRLKHLSDQSISPVEDHDFFQCENASKVEAAAHRFFSSSKIKNEFFNADFNKAREVIKSLIVSRDSVKH